ncbi:MAG: hypothetical protein ABI423_06315 [Burkholderiales bacterium]
MTAWRGERSVRRTMQRALSGRVIALFVLLGVPAAAIAHGGDPLDSYGCHKQRGAGGYHCHKGQFAGHTFASKEEMLKEMHRRKFGPRKP